jgi:hypothetical protein
LDDETQPLETPLENAIQIIFAFPYHQPDETFRILKKGGAFCFPACFES